MKNKIFFLAVFILCFQIYSLAQVVIRGAEYRTKNSYLYGRFEASIKAPGKEGVLTSLFSYFDGLPNDQWSSSKWNEIDIEIMGRYFNDVQFNTITPNQANHVRHQYVNFDPALDFHTYAFEWTPEYVAWFIDGIEIYKQSEDQIKTLTRAQKLMMNIWSPMYPNWAGVWNDAVLPAFGYYDWAAYYKYTPGNGNYGTGNNFTLDWRDDFNTFDEIRWEKGDHGFSGNRSSFVPENIAFVNSKLILCLTDKNVLGYADNSAPKIIFARAVTENELMVFFSEQVEKTSAEINSNYILSGSVITKATLLSDKRTVDIIVDKIDLNSNPILIVKNVKDLWSPANAMNLVAKSVVMTPKITFPFKVNVGGNAYGDFYADKEFVTDTSNYGFMEGVKGIVYTDPIANTNDDTIYQSEINGLAKYVVRIPNGKYKIKLMLAENYYNTVGNRVFDIYLQGNLVIKALDIYKEVGGKTALEKVIDNVEVKDYLLDIHFAAQISRPLLNGIIIESNTPSDVKEETSIPDKFKLEQNFPNPFNPGTSIRYRLPNFGFVSLKVFDSLGSEIATLVNEEQRSGNYKVDFNANLTNEGRQLSSGVYFYTLRADNYAMTKKMLLIK
ncbi:MAG: family 16 glycosylhydrolase [Melioribacteraceae bacterium]